MQLAFVHTAALPGLSRTHVATPITRCVPLVVRRPVLSARLHTPSSTPSHNLSYNPTSPQHLFSAVIPTALRHLTFLSPALVGFLLTHTPALAQSSTDTSSADPSLASEAAVKLAKEAAENVGDAAAEAFSSAGDQDTSLTSRVLVIVFFSLLIYATIGSIFLAIDSFLVRRNDKRERQWVLDRLDGKPIPKTRWSREDMSLPKDFPVRPKPQNRAATDGIGNRRTRRQVEKYEKSSAKERAAKKRKSEKVSRKKASDADDADTKS